MYQNINNQPNSASSVTSSFHTEMNPLASSTVNLQLAPSKKAVKLNQHYSDETDIKLNTMVENFWVQQKTQVSNPQIDFKYHPLPLARVKKVMKADPAVKQMISSEAPLIFSKACEIFVAELTSRAWVIAEENKRRTLQRNDIVAAMSKSDQYDFLVDLVPKDEHFKDPFKRSQAKKKEPSSSSQSIPPTHLNSPSTVGAYYATQPAPAQQQFASQQWDRTVPYTYMQNDNLSQLTNPNNLPYPMSNNSNTQYYPQNTPLNNTYTDPLLTTYQPPTQTYPNPFSNSQSNIQSLRQDTYNLGSNPLNLTQQQQPQTNNILSSPPPLQPNQLPTLHRPSISSSILDRTDTQSASNLLRPLNTASLSNTFSTSPSTDSYSNALGLNHAYPAIVPGVMPASVHVQNMDPAAATNAMFSTGLPLLNQESTDLLNKNSAQSTSSSLNPSRRTSGAQQNLLE